MNSEARLFATAHLPVERQVVAPDGADVRVLLELTGGGLAHFTLAAGATSIAVHHRSVEEISVRHRRPGTNVAKT